MADAPSETGDGDASDVQIVFDGECPVCNAYTCNIEMNRSSQLINARDGGDAVDRLVAAGVDLDEGMAVIIDGKVYHGADAVHIMAINSKDNSLLAKINRAVFRSPTRARLLYPLLRFGRNALLRLLGRKKINPGKQPSSALR
jgi:predicted DCC family thiol-disulfide oxidoreductase YuxK